MRFTVIPIDGDPENYFDVYTPAMTYSSLTWAESVELARMSFQQGYTVIIWKEDMEGGSCECGTVQGSKEL